MIKHGLKAVLGTDHGRWGIGTLIVAALFLTGHQMLSILLAVYNQIFFIGYAVDAAASGNKKSMGEAAVESHLEQAGGMMEMEEAMEMADKLFGDQEEEQKTEGDN